MPSLEAEISISIFAEYPQLFDRLFKHKQSSQNFLENLKLVQKPHFVLIAIAPMFAYLLQTLICHSMYSLIYTCIILLEYILYCIIYISIIFKDAIRFKDTQHFSSYTSAFASPKFWFTL